jgi:hypothetical protein
MSTLEQYRTRPKLLYKYRSFDINNHSLSILSQNKIFFSSPKHFNDPFDSAIRIRFDIGTKDQIIQKIMDLEKHSNPIITQSKARQIAKKRWKEGDIYFKKNPDNIHEEMKNNVFNTAGVFSLTEDSKNLLMWSHYALSHEGFCIEFDGIMLGNFFANYSYYYNKLAMLYKVDYSNNYPIVNPYLDTPEQRMIKSFLVKSKEWEYEKEWRIIYYNGADLIFEIPQELITKVMVGINISNDNLALVKEIMTKRKIKIPLLHAKMEDSEFGIDFYEINY